MANLLNTNKRVMLAYAIVSAVALSLSCLGFISSYISFFPLLVTSIAFLFGFFYLLLLLKSIDEKGEGHEATLTSAMLSNVLRFVIMGVGAALSAVAIYFIPKNGEMNNYMFLLLLINGLPMMICILLFYFRGKSVK